MTLVERYDAEIKFREAMRIVGYIAFHPGDEGHGGKRRNPFDLSGEWYPGSRLRYPSMPLYEMNTERRDQTMKRLCDLMWIKVTGVVDEKNCYEVGWVGMNLIHELYRSGLVFARWSTFYNRPGTSVTWQNSHWGFLDETRIIAIRNNGNRGTVKSSNWSEMGHIYTLDEIIFNDPVEV